MLEIKDLENTILNADCLDILKQLPDKCIDLVLTDPPYGTTSCKWDSVIPFDKMWNEVERIRKDFCPVVLFGQEPFSSMLRVSNIGEYKYDWVWEKQKAANFMSMKHQPAKYHELISVFYKHDYYPIMWETENKDNRKTINNQITNKECHLGAVTRIRNADSGLRYPKSIIKINKPINGNIHPTQKPVELLEYLIKTYTKENDIVLDFTSGSGSLAIACLKTKRNFLCIEKDKDYYEASVKRLEEHQKQLTLF